MLGYLATSHQQDAPLYALVRGTRRPVHLVPLPFVPKRYKRAS
jgi:hypothetical protein